MLELNTDLRKMVTFQQVCALAALTVLLVTVKVLNSYER